MEINIQEKQSLGRMEFGLKCVNYFPMTRLYVLNTLRIVAPFRLMILPLTAILMMYICGLDRIYILCNTLLEEASFITKWSYSKAAQYSPEIEKTDQWGTPEEMDQVFAGTCEAVQTGISYIQRQRRWPMYDRNPISNWTKGRITLTGDAAHPMLQYLAKVRAKHWKMHLI